MRFSSSGLLHQLALEYNDLINTEALSLSTQHFVKQGDYDGFFTSRNDSDEEEMDDRLQGIEDEMCLLILGISRNADRQLNLIGLYVIEKERKIRYDEASLHAPDYNGTPSLYI